MHVELERVDYARGELTESYENGPSGVEQRFVLLRQPDATGGELVLQPTLEGSTAVPVAERLRVGHDLELRDLAAHDVTGAEVPGWFETDGTTIEIVLDDRGAAWPIVVDPLLTTTWIVDPPQQVQAYFGMGLAAGDVNKDGFDDLILCAPGWDSAGTTVDEGIACYTTTG